MPLSSKETRCCVSLIRAEYIENRSCAERNRIYDIEVRSGSIWICQDMGDQRILIRAQSSDISSNSPPIPFQLSESKEPTLEIRRATYPENAKYLEDGDMIWCGVNSELELWDDGSGFVVVDSHVGETSGSSTFSPSYHQNNPLDSAWRDFLGQTCLIRAPFEPIPSYQLTAMKAKRRNGANLPPILASPFQQSTQLPPSPLPKRSRQPTPFLPITIASTENIFLSLDRRKQILSTSPEPPSPNSPYLITPAPLARQSPSGPIDPPDFIGGISSRAFHTNMGRIALQMKSELETANGSGGSGKRGPDGIGLDEPLFLPREYDSD